MRPRGAHSFRESKQVHRWDLKRFVIEQAERLHVYGLVAKIPRSRRWRVSAFDYRLMSASLRLRHIHFPALHADAAKAA